MIAMDRQFKQVISANIVLALLYFFVVWGEYSALTTFSKVAIQTSFPLYMFIQEIPSSPFVGRIIFFLNYPLIIFLSAIIVNLYFIYSLQKNKETKPPVWQVSI